MFSVCGGQLQACRTELDLLSWLLQVLAVGSKITVLGEVGPDPEGADGDVLLRKASPASIFDLKTASISRPFVVSTKTEQALLEVGYRSSAGNGLSSLRRGEELDEPPRTKAVRLSMAVRLRCSFSPMLLYFYPGDIPKALIMLTVSMTLVYTPSPYSLETFSIEV